LQARPSLANIPDKGATVVTPLESAMYVQSEKLKMVIRLIQNANELAYAAQQLGALLIEEETYGLYRNRQSTPTNDYVSLKKFREEMGLSSVAYRKLRAEGKTPPEVRLVKNIVRISSAEIEKWKAKRAAGAR
jgi:predicted DNA-binding transcriptional regulator AlpA